MNPLSPAQHRPPLAHGEFLAQLVYGQDGAFVSRFACASAAPNQAPAASEFPTLMLPFLGESLVLAADTGLPAGREHLPGEPDYRITLGSLGDFPCELWLWRNPPPLPETLLATHYRALWGAWTGPALAAVTRARQLAQWLLDHQFCGRCGHPMEVCGGEPAQACPACGHRSYPRISPVCMGLITRGDEVLLGRSPHFPPGVFSALAGFLEAGESAEECLRREILEEAGIQITSPRWFGSQAWPYPSTLMMGFTARYLAGELCPQPGEIEALDWFRADHLPSLPHPSSLAYQMIAAWRENPKAFGA